jgi:hypothetical protein
MHAACRPVGDLLSAVPCAVYGRTGAGGDHGIDHNSELAEISLRFYIFAIPLSISTRPRTIRR